MVEQQSNGKGVASLILGIASIVLCWISIIGLASGIVGLILAIKQKKVFPNGMATAGLVTSIVGIVFSLFVTVIFVLVIITGLLSPENLLLM